MYIGNTPTTQAFTPAIDYFSGNGSTVAFTLSRQVASVAQVQAVIENVPQSPGTAFTVSGNVITFTSAPPSGTNNIYVYYTSPITQVIAPGQGTVGTAQLADAAVTGAKIDPTTSVSVNALAVNSNNISAVNSLGFRNRIINGDMRIDQRNNGASVTSAALNAASQAYFLDRWRQDTTANASFTYQQNAGSVTPPVGFTNYAGATSTAAYTPGTNTTHRIGQYIEGFNVADLAWGTANAQTVTLSFWVRSSLTGTQSGSLSNNGGTRSYVYSFTVNAANTWEYKTITIPGDTTGTWLTNNGTGLIVGFNLGTGTGTFGTTTANTWQAGNLVGLTNAVQVSATNGATFYITGVQLEAGSVATPFERRDYGRELAMCQRYYYENIAAVGTGIGANSIARATALHPVEMRASPSVTIANTVQFFNGGATVTCTGGLNNYSTPRMFNADLSIGSGGVTGYATCMVQPPTGKVTVSAEL